MFFFFLYFFFVAENSTKLNLIVHFSKSFKNYFHIFAINLLRYVASRVCRTKQT